MSAQLEDLPNIGPKVAAALAAVGIADADALRRIGAVEAYRCMRQHSRHWNLMCLYALQAGLLGMDVFAMPEELKARLRQELETPI